MFQVPSTIANLRTLADNTLRIQVDCQELPPEQMTEVFRLKGRLGWFVFSENVLNQSDIPEESAPEFKGDKSPSQRLRAALYVYWEKCTGKQQTFKAFYESWVEQKIGNIKDHLPE